MIRILFAVAVGAFVLSLPIHTTVLGASLRRVAGFCFTLALVPSIVVGLFFPGGVDAHPVLTGFILVLLAVTSYAVLHLRSVLLGGAKPKSPRIREKTPVDRSRRREQEFFDLLAERQQRGDE